MITSPCGRAIVAVLMLLLLDTATACTSSATTTVGPASDATAFFAHYLAADGRIVRVDQGGDTVSEGQAYGLLIAVGARDPLRFAKIWGWTRTHLQRPDHLLAWRWQDAKVMDAMPAADADIDTAVALLKAADQFHQAAYRSAGVEIANSVLAHETVNSVSGSLVVAGPWAVASPAVVNPGYVVSGTASYLALKTGNSRWRSIATATASLDTHLVASSLLPPDWAHLSTDLSADQATASGAPDGSAPAQFGLDAVRLVIRLASSCSAADRALAARYATRLGSPGAAGIRSLTGQATVDWRNPATDIGLYAAQLANGNSPAANAALRSARSLDNAVPTYFGMAWIALGPMLFASNLTPSCQ